MVSPVSPLITLTSSDDELRLRDDRRAVTRHDVFERGLVGVERRVDVDGRLVADLARHRDLIHDIRVRGCGPRAIGGTGQRAAGEADGDEGEDREGGRDLAHRIHLDAFSFRALRYSVGVVSAAADPAAVRAPSAARWASRTRLRRFLSVI